MLATWYWSWSHNVWYTWVCVYVDIRTLLVAQFSARLVVHPCTERRASEIFVVAGQCWLNTSVDKSDPCSRLQLPVPCCSVWHELQETSSISVLDAHQGNPLSTTNWSYNQCSWLIHLVAMAFHGRGDCLSPFWSDRELLDNFCTVFVSLSSRVSRLLPVKNFIKMHLKLSF